MEIKDFCDDHGEPICVGDVVRFSDADDYVFCGEVISLSPDRIMYKSNIDHEKHIRQLGPSSKFEIISKYKKEESKPDMVNHPPHYQSETGIEVIDVIEAFTADLKGGEATNTGNVIKYILRWPHKKNPLEDLQKARWYLDRLINLVEKRMKKENA